MSATTSQLAHLAGWYFLPNLVTGWIQSFYYRLMTRAGDAYPVPGSPQHDRHRRNIFAMVIIGYLLYSVYEVDWKIQQDGDFYRDLGVPHNVDDRTLQSTFRRLTLVYHPDKFLSDSPEQKALVDSYFVHLKTARDTLLSPNKRFAYDRFGPGILEWKSAKTKLEYLHHGLLGMIPDYTVSLASLVFLTYFKYAPYGRYWQCFTSAAMLFFELHTITRPTFPLLFQLLTPMLRLARRPPYLPYQAILLARRLTLSIFIAVAQIAPQLHESFSSRAIDDSPETQALLAKQLQRTVEQVDADATRLVGLEAAPFVGPGSGGAEMERKVKKALADWLVLNEVRGQREVQEAIGRVVRRRNREKEIMEED